MGPWGWSVEYFRHIRPAVVHQLQGWRTQADAIPHPDLRRQALESLTQKQFHCEGGGVFGAPSRDPSGAVMKFLIPYQTLCDYLDTMTDRGPSLDAENFRTLHQSLLDAVTPHAGLHDYYRLHPFSDDGGYMARLVGACQSSLQSFPGFSAVKSHIRRLCSLYIDLQVLKHGPVAERITGLKAWYTEQGGTKTGLEWWEFAAATGSTLGIFALLGEALSAEPDPRRVDRIYHLYFPWMGALHILLDYLIDQSEDALGGDLNFVAHYADAHDATRGIRRIYLGTLAQTAELPDAAFHRYVARGLLGFYLSDQKVRHSMLARSARTLLRAGGPVSFGIWMAARVGRSP